MRRWICTILCLVLCIGLSLPASADGYSVSIPKEVKVAAGGTASIPITVSGGSYNVVDLRITFDRTKLEYVSSTLPADKIAVGQGSLSIRLYGNTKGAGSTALSVTFQLAANASEGGDVKITSAKVDNSGHALNSNAPSAAILNGITTVVMEGYSVSLPTGFKGESVAYPGKDYTFAKPAGSTEYTVFASVNGKTVTCKKNGDGTYTIEGKYITGPLIIKAEKSQTGSGSGGNNGHFTPGSGGTTGDTTGTKANYKQLWVQPYVELDNATVFLIAVSGSPKSGRTYAYDGDPMFFTEKYRSSGAAFGENVYLYLQIVKSGESMSEADAAQKITEIKGTSPAITVDLDMDGSGKVNEKDAKVVHNVYNALYWDFDDLPMAAFLEADMNLDGIVDVKDADVVVYGRTAQ